VKERNQFENFSLSGGPLHRLGRCLRLVRGDSNSVALGLALGIFLWAVLIALTFIDGVTDQVFSMTKLAGHLRLLIAIPLLFLCEAVVAPRISTFMRGLVTSKIVTPAGLPALETELERISRWRDAWMPEAVLMIAAILFSISGSNLALYGTTASHAPGSVFGGIGLAGQWYWVVCLTLFRFLMFRWVWQLALWCHFLWRLSRLELRLVPTHPDGAGGMGYLEVVHAHFLPLVLALSVIQSASLAEGMAAGTISFDAAYPVIILILLVDAVLFLGPLFILTPMLYQCRVQGLDTYMEFAAHYVDDFDRKWLQHVGEREQLLGTSDLQSLADLGNSINIVRNMRIAPISVRLLLEIAIAALLPMLPLLLFMYPAAELAEKFFMKLAGM